MLAAIKITLRLSSLLFQRNVLPTYVKASCTLSRTQVPPASGFFSPRVLKSSVYSLFPSIAQGGKGTRAPNHVSLEVTCTYRC